MGLVITMNEIAPYISFSSAANNNDTKTKAEEIGSFSGLLFCTFLDREKPLTKPYRCWSLPHRNKVKQIIEMLDIFRIHIVILLSNNRFVLGNVWIYIFNISTN